jgi:KipI family sensor histidine kinase inhibitor
MKKPPFQAQAGLHREPDDVLIRSAGDSALTIEFEARIDPSINIRVAAMAARIGRLRLSGVLEVVPTYRSVTVYYNPLLLSDVSLKARLAEVAFRRPRPSRIPKKLVEIPVCYDEEFGPDLRAVSAMSGLGAPKIIEWHTSPVYRVYMLGFLPGFPYMAEVPAAIAVPRLSTPRRSVPVGSVGIADAQTGIYPVESPGGWRVIGRTPVRIFDPHRRRPFLLDAGDRVRFRAIDRRQYDRLSQQRIRLPV